MPHLPDKTQRFMGDNKGLTTASGIPYYHNEDTLSAEARVPLLGVNYEQLPVNRFPYAVNNYERDGAMRLDGNGGSAPNYFPNSFDDIKPNENYKAQPLELDTNIADHYNRNAENDHYTQPGIFYLEVLSDYDKKNLVNNIVGSMKGISGQKIAEIINRQLCHFFRADIGLRMAIDIGAEVNVEESQSLFPHKSAPQQQLT